jgi:hypothetical protein
MKYGELVMTSAYQEGVKMYPHAKPLTNLQLEIIKLYSIDLEPQELLDLKQILADFFARKAIKEADKIWDKRNLSDQTMELWLNEG